MMDFISWCKKHSYDVSDLKTEGSTKRAGVRKHAYPELYSRGQYPKAYLRPTVADAPVYQEGDK